MERPLHLPWNAFCTCHFSQSRFFPFSPRCLKTLLVLCVLPICPPCLLSFPSLLPHKHMPPVRRPSATHAPYLPQYSSAPSPPFSPPSPLFSPFQLHTKLDQASPKDPNNTQFDVSPRRPKEQGTKTKADSLRYCWRLLECSFCWPLSADNPNKNSDVCRLVRDRIGDSISSLFLLYCRHLSSTSQSHLAKHTNAAKRQTLRSPSINLVQLATVHRLISSRSYPRRDSTLPEPTSFLYTPGF